MSALPPAAERTPHAQVVAGFLAAAAIFVSLLGVAYRPLRLVPVALVLALIASAMARSDSNRRMAFAAVLVGAFSFAVGLTLAVITSNPLF